MKRLLAITVVLFLGLAMATLASAGDMQLKVGDKVYACNCGEGCPCQTLSMNPGECSCGNPLAEGEVVEVGDGTVVVQTADWKRTFKTDGKFACNCGAGCNCNTVSQSHGKCSCGKDLAEKPN